MATLSCILNLRNRWRAKHKTYNPKGMTAKSNVDLEDIDDKYWDEARRMCREITARRKVAR